jgi:hypothetical protein
MLWVAVLCRVAYDAGGSGAIAESILILAEHDEKHAVEIGAMKETAASVD